MFGARHYLTGLVVCAEIKHFIIKSSSNHRYLRCEAAFFFLSIMYFGRIYSNFCIEPVCMCYELHLSLVD